MEPLINRQVLLQRLPRGGVVCELGVNEGDFSADILRIAQPRSLKLVDPWDSERYGEDQFQLVTKRFENEIDAGQVELIRGFSTEVGCRYESKAFDWVYIDTSHRYALTRDELRLYASKLKPDGILAGHDYAVGNVVKGVVYGVIAAVHEFCVTEGWEIVHLTMEQAVPPSFALRKIEFDN